ncbi:excalibur calcium-binding domain-containing protein [Halocynthiibacter sp.]|uniref:excalibur calcium-binding domain-containing protein n=1 Tax=Halocynthiibacter sp. TaxID=1979210 RepID=UPI003C4ABD33
MKTRSFILLVLLAACGASPDAQPPEVLSARIAAETNSSLCIAYGTASTTPRGKLMIEAELAARGVNQCFSSNYGHASVSTYGRSRYERPAISESTMNCSDFRSGAEAQKYFLAAGGPVQDRHNLDADGDGLACEWGTQVRRISRYRAPVPRVYRPRCYVGPRGGTYTITASGRKNYDGC